MDLLPSILALLFVAPSPAKAEIEPIWTWSQKGMELLAPSFSDDATEIVLTRKFHWPDGHEAESVSEARFADLHAKKKRNPRFADPEVVVLSLGRGPKEVLRWGWSPTFSPDGKRIAYAFQKKPISGLRDLAGSLEGNEIVLYERRSAKVETLAVPDAGYLDGPTFSPDGKRIFYSLMGPINGAYGGPIGLASVEVDTRKVTVRIAPQVAHGLNSIIDAVFWLGQRLMAYRSAPVASGRYMSNIYQDELLDGDTGRTIYRWKSLHSLNDDEKTTMAVLPNGRLFIRDGGSFVLDSKDGKVTASSIVAPPAGYISPDGEKSIEKTEKLVTIRWLGQTGKQKTWPFQGALQGVSWAKDSKRVALVITKYSDPDDEVFSKDELVVFDLDRKD